MRHSEAVRELEGLQVVVTGGSGALGAAVVESLLDAGAMCHVPGRAGSAAPPGSSTGSDRLHVTGGVELTSEHAVRRYYESLPPLWASIHCAGGFSMAPIEEISADDFNAMLSMNALSAFLCCREAIRGIRKTGRGGRVVNVVARPAVEPRTGGGMTAYAASKAAVAALTESLAEEVAREGIWVNAVAPSILDTKANRRSMPDASFDAWPKLDEVARTIRFLVSPANATVRGSIVKVYGRS